MKAGTVLTLRLRPIEVSLLLGMLSVAGFPCATKLAAKVMQQLRERAS